MNFHWRNSLLCYNTERFDQERKGKYAATVFATYTEAGTVIFYRLALVLLFLLAYKLFAKLIFIKAISE